MRVFVVLLLILNSSLFAQKEKRNESLLDDTAEWFEGSVTMSDGSELKGLVKYNENSGILGFQDKTDPKTLTASRVASFNFNDLRRQKQRIFVSLPYDDPSTDIVTPRFFEVLKEYSTFAVLSHTGPIYVADDSKIMNPYAMPSGTRMGTSQTETIFLMNSEGEIKPYIINIYRDTNSGTGYVKESSKLLDNDLLEEFIKEPHYQKLNKFAKQNGLKFKQKEDFLKILNYYDELIAN
jgi:hypothetical protein